MTTHQTPKRGRPLTKPEEIRPKCPLCRAWEATPEHFKARHTPAEVSELAAKTIRLHAEQKLTINRQRAQIARSGYGRTPEMAVPSGPNGPLVRLVAFTEYLLEENARLQAHIGTLKKDGVVWMPAPWALPLVAKVSRKLQDGLEMTESVRAQRRLKKGKVLGQEVGSADPQGLEISPEVDVVDLIELETEPDNPFGTPEMLALLLADSHNSDGAETPADQGE